MFRRSRPAELADVEDLVTREQLLTLDRARALAAEAEVLLTTARIEAEHLIQEAQARARLTAANAELAVSRATEEAEARAARLLRAAETQGADRVAMAEADAARIRAEALGAATRTLEEGRRQLAVTTAGVNQLLEKAEQLGALFRTDQPGAEPPTSGVPGQTNGRDRQVTTEKDRVLSALRSLEIAISAASTGKPGRS